MKHCYYLFFLLITISVRAQYKGGTGDGFSNSQVTSQNPLSNIYKGGVNDGFSAAQATTQNPLNNIYSGGVNDGFATVIVTGQNPMNNIYAGGSDDGFAHSLATNQNFLNNIYAGGNDDGFSSSIVLAQNPLNNIYSGGVNDGFAQSAAVGQNPLNNIYAGGVNDGFATIIVYNQNPLGTLPVRLLEFSGRWQQQDIALWWRTANEENSSHFEVQRSADNAGNFETIATIAASGYSTVEKRYDLIDRNVPSGTVIYYRLKSVDISGQFSYSAIIRFTKNAREVVYTIYPNPGRGLFNISLSGVTNFSDRHYRVLDGNGALVAQGNVSSSNTQFDIKRMPAGIYYVQVIYHNKPENTYKIILQH